VARQAKLARKRKEIAFGISSENHEKISLENLPENPAQTSEQIPENPPTSPAVENLPDGFPARTNEVADPDRISFKVVDGKIDVDSVRESKAESVKKVLQASIADEKFKNWSGITPPPTAASAPAFTPLVMGQAFDMVAYIQAGLYGKKYAVNPAELYPLLAMTEVEHRQIDEIAAQCANKYLPAAMAQWSDLAICGMTLVGIYRAKAQAVETYVKVKFDKQVTAATHDEKKDAATAPVAPAPGAYTDAQRKRSLG
jgi:hypothetical protein